MSAVFAIRRATPPDLPQLAALLDRYYAEWNVLQRDSPEQVSGYLHQPEPFGFLVAADANTLVGCVLLRTLPSIPSAAECKRLYVAPEFRSHRLASQLMDHVERIAAHNLAWIYLDTANEFTAAQLLYRKRSYEICERFNDNPQATFFFRKRLAI